MPIVETPEIDERDAFLGNYKVYNENGNHLYDMEIDKNVYVYTNDSYSNKYDSLYIKNFAGRFDIVFWHSRRNFGFDSFSFHKDSLVDFDGNTWYIFCSGNETYNKPPENDTMLIQFNLSNIKYYIGEGQLYYDCECKHIAVKQD